MSRNISCIPTGVQHGYDRLLDQDDIPAMKGWRCELTALSHLYNLYFVACNDTIHVYQPNFPDQHLSDEPLLIIQPPVTLEAGGVYGIDENDPHSITRLVVAYLGSDEVLLMTCDDGDVIGYRVEEICYVVEQQLAKGEDESNSVSPPHVRYFLHRNVGASAWGLAVHQQGRILAISANTHEVTVLAYALSSNSPSYQTENDFDSEFETPVQQEEDSASDFPLPRRRDHIFTLKSKTNIPAVAFDNTGDDSSGRWLYSSSIDGRTTIWDLHHLKEPARVIQIGWCASISLDPWKAPDTMAGYCECSDRANVIHAAWTSVKLDTRSAYRIPSDEETKMMSPHLDGHFCEFTKDKERFKMQMGYAHQPQIPDNNTDTGMSIDSAEALSDSDDSDSSSDVSMGSHHDITNPEPQDDGVTGNPQTKSQGELEMTDSTEESGEENSAVAELTINNHVSVEEDSLFVPDDPPMPPPEPPSSADMAAMQIPWLMPMPSNAFLMMDTDSDDSDEMGFFIPNTAPSLLLLRRTLQKQPYCEITESDVAKSIIIDESPQSPSSPILILTKEEIFLLQQPFPTPPNKHNPEPIKTMRRPLHTGPWAPFTGSFDRLCYFEQIPELGIFIVASPVGRAAIFSIYYVEGGEEENHPRRYGFKIEYILPFLKGKETEVVSITKARLVGVAVAPVQGMCDVKDGGGEGGRWGGKQSRARGDEAEVPRRWRLMMYYTDNTVLSFELEKKREGQTTVGDLVV